MSKETKIQILERAISGTPCAGTGNHEFTTSDSGPCAGYDDGVPYCIHCGECLFDLSDRELRKLQAK